LNSPREHRGRVEPLWLEQETEQVARASIAPKGRWAVVILRPVVRHWPRVNLWNIRYLCDRRGSHPISLHPSAKTGLRRADVKTLASGIIDYSPQSGHPGTRQSIIYVYWCYTCATFFFFFFWHNSPVLSMAFLASTGWICSALRPSNDTHSSIYCTPSPPSQVLSAWHFTRLLYSSHFW